ncbi:hypothetical protein PR202_gb21312 [Eleusine coracana subsp. coracana]|uniref:C2H2-type domain-containing protein n=1 Tax=Eleusine coracana subsp. coracana TaxID=191504 RepID=A0AAV5FAU7_ELECO|nr:hypothetical protein PR202_gb21312 [Eleusine coracana subsp. coracana]
MDSSFPFTNMLRRSQKVETCPNSNKISSSWWSSSLLNAASNFKTSAEAGMQKLSTATSQAFQKAKDGISPDNSSSSSSSRDLVEQCVHCPARFSTVGALIEHVEKSHQMNSQSSRGRVTIDVCPKCHKAFWDPVLLVEHVERDHGGTSKA